MKLRQINIHPTEWLLLPNWDFKATHYCYVSWLCV